MKNLIPKRRFEEFKDSDPWEQRKLGELSSLITKGTTPLDKSGNGDINFIKIENIDSSSGEIISTTKITSTEHNGYLKRSQLQKDDILFSIAGTLGRVTTVNEDILPANTNQALAIIRLKDGYLNYITTFLKGRAVGDYIRRNPTIGAQPNLSLEQVGNLEIGLPSFKEQEKIGSFFSNLDNLITLHQRKLDKLKETKSAYLSEMFPKEGEFYPKRRFAGFTDPWEQRKLGELLDVSTGKLDANAMVEDGEYDFYTSGIKKYRIDIPAFEGPAITIAGNGATVGYMHLADGKFNAYQRTYVLEGFQADRQFLYSEISNRLPRKIAEEARTGNIPYIVMDMLTDLNISLPVTEEEQRKIGTFFSNLDNLITLHQRKLDKLQALKQAYLSEMFV